MINIEFEQVPIPAPGKKHRACVIDRELGILTCADGDSYPDAQKNAKELMEKERHARQD